MRRIVLEKCNNFKASLVLSCLVPVEVSSAVAAAADVDVEN